MSDEEVKEEQPNGEKEIAWNEEDHNYENPAGPMNVDDDLAKDDGTELPEED